MNVFFCCFQAPRKYETPPYEHWIANFTRPMHQLGHQVLEPQNIDFALPFIHRNESSWLKVYREETSDELLSQVKRTHERTGIDLFFSYFYEFHVLPSAIEEIGKLGIPTVNFFCDNLREFHSVQPLINSYSLNWVPEKEACILYEKARAPYVYLPMAADPADCHARGERELSQVTFVGSSDGLRTRLFSDVLKNGTRLQIYGAGWEHRSDDVSSEQPPMTVSRFYQRVLLSLKQHANRIRHLGTFAEVRHFLDRGLRLDLLDPYSDVLHPPVLRDEMFRLAVESAVYLGVNRCPHPGYPMDAPLVYSRLRDVEAPMMGACYLTETCPDVEYLYDVGTEVAVYQDAEQLSEEANRLLEDCVTRANLRRRGREAALARHTWRHRFESLFQTLGLPTQ